MTHVSVAIGAFILGVSLACEFLIPTRTPPTPSPLAGTWHLFDSTQDDYIYFVRVPRKDRQCCE